MTVSKKEQETRLYSTKIGEFEEKQTNKQKKLLKLTRMFTGSSTSVNLTHFTSSELLADQFSKNKANY